MTLESTNVAFTRTKQIKPKPHTKLATNQTILANKNLGFQTNQSQKTQNQSSDYPKNPKPIKWSNKSTIFLFLLILEVEQKKKSNHYLLSPSSIAHHQAFPSFRRISTVEKENTTLPLLTRWRISPCLMKEKPLFR